MLAACAAFQYGEYKVDIYRRFAPLAIDLRPSRAEKRKGKKNGTDELSAANEQWQMTSMSRIMRCSLLLSRSTLPKRILGKIPARQAGLGGTKSLVEIVPPDLL